MQLLATAAHTPALLTHCPTACAPALQVQGIQEERQGCEGLVSQMGQRTQQLQGWLADNERKVAAAAGGQLDVDKVLVPADELTKQELQVSLGGKPAAGGCSVLVLLAADGVAKMYGTRTCMSPLWLQADAPCAASCKHGSNSA